MAEGRDATGNCIEYHGYGVGDQGGVLYGEGRAVQESEICGSEQTRRRDFGRNGRWGSGDSIMCRRTGPYNWACIIELPVDRGWDLRRGWGRSWERVR